MKCIYCLSEKDDSEFSLEHIVPQSMGGGKLLDYSLLKTDRVCRRCNSLCGLFVDNACLKSWLNYNAKSQSEWNLSGYAEVSPAYMGLVKLLSSEDEVCDYWLLPKGSQVFCFYPKEEKYLAHAGGNPINRHRGTGKAILILSEAAAKDLEEVKRTINSFCAFFSAYEKYVYNFEIENHEEIFSVFDESSEVYRIKIKTVLGTKMNVSVLVDPLQALRFPCKIALALGYNLFGDSFLDLEYTNELRKGLWYKNGQENDVRGISSLYPDKVNDNVQKMFRIGRANSLALIKSGNALSCIMSIYGNVSIIKVCDDVSLMGADKATILDDGKFLAWHPRIELSSGFISMADLANHKSNLKVNDALRNLENLLDKD